MGASFRPVLPTRQVRQTSSASTGVDCFLPWTKSTPSHLPLPRRQCNFYARQSSVMSERPEGLQKLAALGANAEIEARRCLTANRTPRTRQRPGSCSSLSFRCRPQRTE